MKQCPRCRAVVRDDTECPFCHETLTYENPVMQDKPHTPWNRYTVLFWLKAVWFPLVCLVACIVRLLTLPETAPRFSELGFGGPLPFIGLFFAFLLSRCHFCKRSLWLVTGASPLPAVLQIPLCYPDVRHRYRCRHLRFWPLTMISSRAVRGIFLHKFHKSYCNSKKIMVY